MEALSNADLQAALAELPGWELRGGKLHRELRFRSFVAAWGFMSRVALIAERSGHHPDWWNSYDRVVIDLVTHEAGAVTARDVALARLIEKVLAAG